MSFKDKAQKFGRWAEENSSALIIGAATVGMIGFSLYARKVVKDEEMEFLTWKASEEEKGNKVLPGPEGYYYLFDNDGNQSIAVR